MNVSLCDVSIPQDGTSLQRDLAMNRKWFRIELLLTVFRGAGIGWLAWEPTGVPWHRRLADETLGVRTSSSGVAQTPLWASG